MASIGRVPPPTYFAFKNIFFLSKPKHYASILAFMHHPSIDVPPSSTMTTITFQLSFLDYHLQKFIEWDLVSITITTTMHTTFFYFPSFLLYSQFHRISSVLPPPSLSFCFLPSPSRIFFFLPFSSLSI